MATDWKDDRDDGMLQATEELKNKDILQEDQPVFTARRRFVAALTSRLLALLLGFVALSGCVDGRNTTARTAEPSRTSAASGDSLPALEIRFLDVGQGDAILIRNGTRTALIDTGPSDAVASRLRALGVDTIHLFVASHNHADHIGGADAVLRSFPVRFYLDNGHPASTRIQARVLALVDSTGATYLNATPRTLSLGDARLRIVPAPDNVPGDEQNNRSVTVLLERGSFRALFTGDSETELLQALLETDQIPDVDLLKAAHHGSRNGVTPAWLARTKPEVVAISAGSGNRYGHPSPAALRYYCTAERRVLRTDLAGDIVIAVDPSGTYQVDTQRSRNVGEAATTADDGCPRPSTSTPRS
jgi:competence protein ComEC